MSKEEEGRYFLEVGRYFLEVEGRYFLEVPRRRAVMP